MQGKFVLALRILLVCGMSAGSASMNVTTAKDEKKGRELMVVEQLEIMTNKGRDVSLGRYDNRITVTGMVKFNADVAASMQRKAIVNAVTGGWDKERRDRDPPKVVFNSTEFVTELDEDGNEWG